MVRVTLLRFQNDFKQFLSIIPSRQDTLLRGNSQRMISQRKF